MIGDRVIFANALFFVILLSLLITLFDRYRQVYLMRFSKRGRSSQEDMNQEGAA